jgi:hypothetical protein
MLARRSDQRAIDAPGETDERRTLGEHHFEPLELVEGQYQVHAVIDTTARTESVKLPAKHLRLRPRRRQRAESTHAGHRAHELGSRRRADRCLHHRHLPGNAQAASLVTTDA